ncbi:MAG: HEAT repeat domain-containing protein [Acidobacteria bacterium]|nr:HEAT repeat domain-containing protein [Acidobacteriota bacterium]
MSNAVSRLKPWLMRVAPIYPGEGRVVFLSLIVNFLVVAGVMFGRTSRDALFLVYFGVQYLPYMYFANAVSLILCSLAYTTLVDRIERGRFLGATSLLFVGILVASRVVLLGHPHWFFPVLYILAQVIWYFTLMQFWTFVGDLFDTRQAKRIFPFLAIGALLGMITVGLFAKRLVKLLGTENLLMVWAGMLLTATLLAGYVYLRYRTVKETGLHDAASLPKQIRPSEWQKIRDGFREVGKEPLLRSMAGYILLMWTVYAVVDFCFSKTMRAKYPDPNDLASFFGVFVGVQGFLCLAIQLFLTRPIISRLGVGKTINFHPGFLIAGTAWMSVQYGYASVLTTKLGDASMLYTFSDSSYQLLYNPISPARRARVRGLIEGYIRPLSLAAAGGLILLGNSYLHPLQVISGREVSVVQQLSWGAALLSLVWFGIALTSNKGYIRALLQNLEADNPAVRLAAATALARLKDPSSVAMFAQSLRNTSPERLVPALQLLETLEIEQAKDTLLELLSHTDARVRATAVSALGRRGIAGFESRLTPLLADSDARVRANTIEALATSKDVSIVEMLRPLLKDASTRVRINSALALATSEGSQSFPGAIPLLQELAHGDEVARSAATYALGRLPFDESMNILSELLKDPVLRIRCDAAQGLGCVGTPRVIPQLIEALAGPPELRHHARRSLASIVKKCGPSCVDELIGIALSTEHAEIRSELADVMGRLKDGRVIEPLLKLLKDPEWRVRWKVLKSFERLARDGPLSPNAREALFQYAHGELTAFRHSMDCTRALVPAPSAPSEELLAGALEEDRLNIQERVFRMLGVLCGREVMREIADELRSPNPRQRADALEALDNLAPKAVGRELLALLEPAPAASGGAQPHGPMVESLVQHPKPWMRACTARYLSDHEEPEREKALRTLLTDRAPLVSETALAAGWKAFGEPWGAQLESCSRSSNNERLRNAARIILARGTDGLEKALSTPRKGENMLLSIEKAVFLKSAPLFSALEGEELAALADIAIESTFAPSEIIFEENQEPHHIYLILQGKVEVFRHVDGRERPLAHLGEKECFGEMAILDNLPRSASVRAQEATTVLKIDRDSFFELIMERPQIAFSIFKILSGRLRHQNLEADHIPAVYSGGKYA